MLRYKVYTYYMGKGNNACVHCGGNNTDFIDEDACIGDVIV